MLYISLGASILLFVISVGAVERSLDRRKTYLKVWFGVLWGLVPCLCVPLPAYLLHAVLTGIAGTACRWAGAGPGAFACGSVGALVIGYVVIGVPRVVELRQAGLQYPFESVEGRLAYETRRPVTQPRPPKTEPDRTADQDRDEWVSDSGGQRREWVLRKLHEDCVHLFVNAPGFGVVRMIGPDLRDVARAESIRDAAPVPLPELPEPGESPAASCGDLVVDLPSGVSPSISRLGSVTLRMLHRSSVGDFTNPLGFGYVRDRGHVAGFISHRFTQFPPKPTKPEGD